MYAQTQDDFMKKLSEVYVNAADQKKASESAKAIYKMVEHHKDLQTYTNYFILGQIFENQAPDQELAKSCKEKADKALAAMTAGYKTSEGTPIDINSQWYNVYYPALFNTTDPDNVTKAVNFLLKNPTLQNFTNYNFVAYGYERYGEYDRAREYYERALTFRKDEKSEFYSYSFYTNFLSRSGEYLKAEEFIERMERLSKEANDLYKVSYKSESLTSKVVYYLSIGDYQSYVQAAEDQFNYFSKTFNSYTKCNPYPMNRYTISAHANEMLKHYKVTEQLWQKRDSSHYNWINCINKELSAGTNKQYPLSMLPIYQIKTGRKSSLKQPIDFYIKEAETHFNSYSQYADLSINYLKASHLGFLGATQYSEAFKPVLESIRNTRNFRESTLPFSNYAYFSMRDRQFIQAKENYDELFKLNINWVNDVIFSFGEKAFITYYNSKLREGYENYHSFVKIAKEKQSSLYPHLSSQAYNNLLFTKSISLKGTQRRKQAFLKANDQSVTKLYEDWLSKKQDLIRHYHKSEETPTDSSSLLNQDRLKKLQEEVNHLENELALKSQDFKKYLKIFAPDWKDIRDKLKDGEAAIEIIRFQWRDQVYYSDTAHYAAYIITKKSQHPEVVYLPDAASELDNKYYKLYKNNIRFKLDDKDSYNHYWKPLKEYLKGINKVFFSPDGIYHLINIPTLKNPETQQYLIDETEIHYTTSCNDLLNETKRKPIEYAVLFGRPFYKMDKDPVSSIVPPDDNTRSLVRNFTDNNISDLPGTEVEVKAIRKEMETHTLKVEYYIGEDATEDKVYKLHSPDILHIATHGYWSGIGNATTEGFRVFNAMVNSGLLMSGVVNYYSSAVYPDTYDGILTAYEAQNLDLQNTSLVILSACETSLGHFDAGEGVYGLQRAFRAAGAQSIMTSLWKVDDNATKDFMIMFYQDYLKTGDTFGAFTRSQKMLKEKYPEPYFWGAFVLTGM